jgi:membrane fusion protein (multidrug efflux system)
MNPIRLRTAILVLAGLPLVACEQKKKPSAPPPPRVPFVEVITRDVPIQVEAIGETAGSLDIQVRARVEGTLEKVHFDEGKPVDKDALLYTIDPAPFQAKVREAEGNVAGAHAKFVRAENDLKRIRPLVEIDALAKRSLDNAIAEFKASEGVLKASRAALEFAKIQLGYTEVRSPIDGLIGVSAAYAGDFVGRSPNPVVLTTVSKLHPIRVRFSITERDYLNLTARYGGDKAAREKKEKEASLELFLANGDKHPHLGRFSFAGREIDPKTGSLTIEAVFDNPERRIRPGQFARVRSTLEVRKNAPLVPQRAVRELQGIYQVVVITPQNKAETRQVQLGVRVGELWMVEKGLSSGERVAVAGLHRIRKGMTVVPIPAAEAGDGEPTK